MTFVKNFNVKTIFLMFVVEKKQNLFSNSREKFWAQKDWRWLKILAAILGLVFDLVGLKKTYFYVIKLGQSVYFWQLWQNKHSIEDIIN